MSIKVAVLGASGETGRSIVDGLLQAPTNFEIFALARPSSIDNALNSELKGKGVEVVAADLKGPEDALVKVLDGIDIVISAVHWQGLGDQFALVNAAKKAGVKRFIPCNFGTVTAPRGIMILRDQKEDVLDHIKRLRVPYTVIEVGWWYQLAIPRVPSGRADNAITLPNNTIAGTGDVPRALTDLRDIGPYVARIIVDDRTLNQSVFFYSELATHNEVLALMEKLSGEKLETTHITEEAILKQLSELGNPPSEPFKAFGPQYVYSQAIRGDNTPEYARYLGHLVVNDFYPDVKPRTLEIYFQEVLDNKADKVYKTVTLPTSGQASLPGSSQ